MSYRVLIPTAGIGSRLGKATKFLNKSLVGIANRPTIAHIIEQFPNDVEFVIALGHKGELVKDFLTLAYPKRKFFFADVYPFEGEGSGLGLSILSCKEFLQQPFIFTSCDTLVTEQIPAPDYNWMGYAKIAEIEQYRTLEVVGDTIKDICEKGIGNYETHKPYIGLAGIQDYKIFWDAMESGGKEAICTGEAHGLRNILEKGIKPICFTWYDTGNSEAFKKTSEAYKEEYAPNILEKANEAIWFVGNNVIKFSADKSFIANRVSRASFMKGYIPEINCHTENMYRYSKATGTILSKAVTLPIFEKLLNHTSNFWKLENISANEKAEFKKNCKKFYKDKTFERVDLFYKNFEKQDGTEKINDLEMPLLKTMLDSVDWDWLADGLPGRFHGDFHFENILYTKEKDDFIFLDWRQDFGGSLTIGDIYYDLAKLLHGIIICHELIAADHYWVDWQQDEIKFDVLRKQILVECENYYYKWLTEKGYDKKKVLTLTALIYLNIAALHHYPYSLLLYNLGKKMLKEGLEK